MKSTISYYQVLTPNHYKQLNIEISYNFSFNLNGQIVAIPATADDKFITFGKNTEYDKEFDTLFISVPLTITGQHALFGSSGIAPNGAKIGVALECYSQKAKYRNVVTASNQLADDGTAFSCTFELAIPEKTVMSELDFSVQLFLAEPVASLSTNNKFLNNKAGVLLGPLDNKKLYLSGVGSLFPIYEEPSNDAKLWAVKFNYEDPAQDTLSESVQLIINSFHKDYIFLNPAEKKYCDRLIYEIIASAVTLLFTDLKVKGFLADLDNAQFSNGSIIHFFVYLKNILELDTSDVTAFSGSLRAYLDKQQ